MCSLLWGACSLEEIQIYCPTHTLERLEEYEGYELTWSEEFDIDGLPDEKTWGYEEGYQRNSELQDYKKADLKHSWVENGKLILQAFKDPHEGINRWTGEPYHFDFSSASVKTQKKKDFQYGRIDIAAKIPVGRGVWPALWLMPTQNIYKDGYGEIDIMEYVWGHGDTHNIVYQTIHNQNTRDGVEKSPSTWTSSNTLDSKFHLYSLIWEKNSIEILFDNKTILTYQRDKKLDSYKQWPFDQPFYLIMNIAVGGGWGGQWGIDEGIFPAQMEVEYIRYYTKIKNGDEDTDDSEEEESTNLIKNGNFESAYAATEKPAVIGRPEVEGINVLNYLNRWSVVNTSGAQLIVDNTTGANDTKNSMKYSIPSLPNWWSTDMTFPLIGVPAGTHTLSFYVKSNKAVSSFALSATVCETADDIALNYKRYKTLVIENGKTEIKQNPGTSGDIYATMAGNVNTTWKKYSITLDIPKNELVKFVIKPHTTCTVGSNNYGLVQPATDVQFWFDEFLLEAGSGEGGGEEETSLIQNPGFEQAFAAGKEPVLKSAYYTGGDKGADVLNFLDCWFAKGPADGTLAIDKTTGANGSGSSLKYAAPKLENYWSTDLSFPFQGVDPGTYKLSFYTKSNQEVSPFVLSVTVCENDADIARIAKFQKTIVLIDGKQTIEYKEGQNDIWATMIGETGKDWRKHEVIINIPINKLVKFVFKPHVSADPAKMDSGSYKLSKVTDLQYWFDDFVLEKQN